jgi:hypothetical protein
MTIASTPPSCFKNCLIFDWASALEAPRPLHQHRTNISMTQVIFLTRFSLDSISIPSAFHFKFTRSMHNLVKTHFVLEMELMITNIHIESVSFHFAQIDGHALLIFFLRELADWQSPPLTSFTSSCNQINNIYSFPSWIFNHLSNEQRFNISFSPILISTPIPSFPPIYIPISDAE